jgi:hypothetical protein
MRFRVILMVSNFIHVGVMYPATMGHRLRPKIMDMIGSPHRQMAGETYTLYQETAPPLQAKEGGHQPKKKMAQRAS